MRNCKERITCNCIRVYVNLKFFALYAIDITDNGAQ